MSDAASETAKPSRQQILNIAEETRVAAVKAGKGYVWNGKSPEEGFDCSGFVRYVYHKAFGEGKPPLLSAAGMYDSPLFSAVETPEPGDLIFFANSGKIPTHVGIVIKYGEKWIGSQTSTGVAEVAWSNSYWKPRILGYRQFKELVALKTSPLPFWSGLFRWV
ncbi:MAG: C40 family peptidase [Acetobacteraceae bacterium]|nr:C40 family peptidase [Acetobacteraceae bacterium]MDW8398013.1 C40 family peptidase [Acetobacteraceae bacterium]